MHQVLLPRPASPAMRAGSRCASVSDLSGTDSTLAHDDQFLTMLADYRCGGGLVRAPEVFARFECCSGMDVGTLAGWIVNRRVICFEWQARMWLPLFQFNQPDMRPPAALRRVLEVLTPRLDAWALACWFGRPNPWLADQGPCDVLDQDPDAVLRAARGDDLPAGT